MGLFRYCAKVNNEHARSLLIRTRAAQSLCHSVPHDNRTVEEVLHPGLDSVEKLHQVTA